MFGINHHKDKVIVVPNTSVGRWKIDESSNRNSYQRSEVNTHDPLDLDEYLIIGAGGGVSPFLSNG